MSVIVYNIVVVLIPLAGAAYLAKILWWDTRGDRARSARLHELSGVVHDEDRPWIERTDAFIELMGDALTPEMEARLRGHDPDG